MGIPLMLPIPISRPIQLRWTPLREEIEAKAAVGITVEGDLGTETIAGDVERAALAMAMAIELLVTRRVALAMVAVAVGESCLPMIPIGSSECPWNIGVSP
jgi:hypothetical protein